MLSQEEKDKLDKIFYGGENYLFGINKCFHSYLYDKIFELLDIELFCNDNIIIDPFFDQIKKYKIDITITTRKLFKDLNRKKKLKE